MVVNLLKRFEVSVTQLKQRLRNDLFFSFRLSMTAGLLAIGIIVVLVIGALMDRRIYDEINTFAASDQSLEQTLSDISRIHWMGRLLRLAFAITAAYFLIHFSLRTLRKVDAQQRRFIDNVSHEFRTPLAIMKTTSEIALRNTDSLSREAALEIIASNLEEVERLSNIMHFYLTLSHAHGRTYIPRKQVVIAKLLTRVRDRFSHRAKDAQVQIALDIKIDGTIDGHETSLEELMTNLTKNAIEHTPPGGQIILGTRQTLPGFLEITVQDTGVGIAEQDLPHVFEPFYRGQNTLPHVERQGTGLGLSIAKEIVQLHGGTIKAESSAHQGTLIRVQLPHKIVRRFIPLPFRKFLTR